MGFIDFCFGAVALSIACMGFVFALEMFINIFRQKGTFYYGND